MIIRRWIGVLCCVALLACLCGCVAGLVKDTSPAETTAAKAETAAPAQTAAAPATEAATLPLPSTEAEPDTTEPAQEDPILEAEGTVYEPVPGRLGEGIGGTQDGCVFKVSFAGAEFFRGDGQEMVRIYYDVENCASWIIPSSDVKIVAVQDGDYLWNETDRLHSTAAHLAHSDMRPGVRARMAAEFCCSWTGGPIYAEASYFMTFGTHYLDALAYPAEGREPAEIEPGLYDDSLVAIFEPAGMPCKPGSEDPRTAVTEPDLGGLPEEAVLERSDRGRVKLNDAVVIDAKEGGKAIEIHVSFTNESGAELSFNNAGYEIRVMQDGMELWWDGDPYEIYSDEAMNKRLADGETAELSFRYCLFTDTPVTVEFCEWADNEAKCGKLFPVQ